MAGVTPKAALFRFFTYFRSSTAHNETWRLLPDANLGLSPVQLQVQARKQSQIKPLAYAHWPTQQVNSIETERRIYKTGPSVEAFFYRSFPSP